MDNFFFFTGRLHPLLVHLPIGMLIAAFLFELLSRSSRYKKLDVAVEPALLWGTFTAIASVISGYFLSQEDGYEDRLVNIHRNFGLATAAFSVLLYFIRKNSALRFPDKKKRKLVRIFLFLPLMILLITTGHFGGSLTHGEEFLTEITAVNSSEFIDPVIRIKAITNIEEAVLYPDIIQPVLESHCYSCHSSKKQKGQLRLDGTDLILKGGKHGRVIEAGNADSSRLFSRLMLPLEDEHHMPPNEKPQLSSATIDLIRLWINEGASFDHKVGSFNNAAKIIQSIQLIANNDGGESNWIPTESVSQANEKVVAKLKASGALLLPISSDNNYLSLSFMNNAPITSEILDQLPNIKDQIISLRLSFTNITDKEMTTISKLDQLQWLYLDHTKISDSAAYEIARLPKLRYLNLVNTTISDQSLATFGSLKNLRKIYLYETKVTADGIKNLVKQLPDVKVDTGNYTMPVLQTDTLIHKRKV